MTQATEKILRSALKLEDSEQLELLSALAAAVEEKGLDPFDAELLAEVERRSDEYDAGKVKTIPWEEVKRMLDEGE